MKYAIFLVWIVFILGSALSAYGEEEAPGGYMDGTVHCPNREGVDRGNPQSVVDTFLQQTERQIEDDQPYRSDSVQ